MPSRRHLRTVLQWTARLLLALLTRTRVYGREHLPRSGACILAGNHEAAIEIVLMLAVAPRPPVFLGTGDVPLDRNFRLLGCLYGFIPYRRGSMDRRRLDQARAVLQRGEPLGVFPEGGIWQPGAKDTRRGAAWLSDRCRAPVAPMGFRDIVGALPRVLALRRPRLSVHIGPPLRPPLLASGPPRERQKALAEVLERRIRELAGQRGKRPDEDSALRAAREPLGLLVKTDHPDARAPTGREGTQVRWTDAEGQALAHFLSTSLLRNVFIENLHRHVGALEPGRGPFPITETIRAVRILRGYFRLRNPGFLAYRFGAARADAVVGGLTHLQRHLEVVASAVTAPAPAGRASPPAARLELLWRPPRGRR